MSLSSNVFLSLLLLGLVAAVLRNLFLKSPLRAVPTSHVGDMGKSSSLDLHKFPQEIPFTNISHISKTCKTHPVLLKGLPPLHKLHDFWDTLLDNFHFDSIRHSRHHVFTLGTGELRHEKLPHIWYKDGKGLEDSAFPTDEDDSIFRYYAGQLEQPLPAPYQSEEKRFQMADTEHLFYKMLWIGDEQVSAQLHYDEPRNIFLQVRGTKTFYLFEAELWPLMYNYPHTSIHKRQSQVDMMGSARDSEHSSSAFSAPFWHRVWPKATRVVLHAGDALYIPPYVYHYVVADSFCVSLSFLNPSDEQVHLAQAWNVELPFNNFPMGHERILLLKLYIWMLAEKISPRPPDVLLRLLFEARFAPHYSHYSSQQDLAAVFSCYSHMDWMNPQAYNYLSKYVDQVADVFLDEKVDIRVAVREIKFGDYMESVLKESIGENNIATFLKGCFG